MEQYPMPNDAQHVQICVRATIDEESGWWVATCDDLPGLFVTGKDKDILQSKLVEALTLLVPRSVELGLLASKVQTSLGARASRQHQATGENKFW